MPQPLMLIKSDGFYRMPLFEEFGLKAVFTTRNYDLRKDKIGASGTGLVRPVQVHGDSVFCAVKPGIIKDTDAVITNKKGLPLTIKTADCLPVFLFDTVNRAAAMVHAGWRGMHKKIISKTIQQMSDKFSSRLADMAVALGPAIRQCCYEVGKEFEGHFPGFVSMRDSRPYFDIVSAAVNELSENGVASEHIYDSGICTSCANDEFFSYRREGKSAGRSTSIIEIL